MSTEKDINLFDLKDWSIQENGLFLINKLISFNVLPATRKCPKGHILTLTKDSSVIDNYKYKCRYKTKNRQKKNTICNYR